MLCVYVERVWQVTAVPVLHQVTSHAEAHALSSASSWSWSPETGNITHQAHSEAHATVDDVSGTAQVSKYLQ